MDTIGNHGAHGVRGANRPHNSRRWRRLRLQHLNRHPLCAKCQELGDLTPATEVHHLRRVSEGGAMWDMSNLQSLCRVCHTRETNLEMGNRICHGVDDDGMPRDPDHPWNRGSR